MATQPRWVQGQLPLPIGGAPPGQPPESGLHPTVTYGLPGGQPATVLPRPPQQVPVQRQPSIYGTQYDPSQIPPAPQPQQPEYPGYPQPPAQPQQQPPQQPPAQPQWHPPGAPQPQPQGGWQPPQGPGQQRAVLDANTLIDGPGVPPELRGRPMGQIMQIYSGLATKFLESQGQVRQPGQAPANQPQPPQQSQAQSVREQVQSAAQPQSGWNWSRPEESIGRVVEEKLGQALAPIMQRTNAQAAAEARLVAIQGIPDFAQLEPHIVQMLAGAPPETLSNPQIWESAADMIRGRLIRSGMYQPTQGQPAQSQPPRQNGQPQWQGQPRFGVNGSQMVPHGSFFTEGPTPPSQFYPQQGLSAGEQEAARKFGMTEEQYMQWRGGVQR